MAQTGTSMKLDGATSVPVFQPFRVKDRIQSANPNAKRMIT